jgi:hypothetical protein
VGYEAGLPWATVALLSLAASAWAAVFMLLAFARMARMDL